GTKKQFSRRSHKCGYYAPVEQVNERDVYKKTGHFKRDSNNLNSEQGNKQPRE
ncbi:hypothetical protein F442_18501, partial [Phytophthora nicotianae P10297]